MNKEKGGKERKKKSSLTEFQLLKTMNSYKNNCNMNAINESLRLKSSKEYGRPTVHIHFLFVFNKNSKSVKVCLRGLFFLAPERPSNALSETLTKDCNLLETNQTRN